MAHQIPYASCLAEPKFNPPGLVIVKPDHASLPDSAPPASVIVVFPWLLPLLVLALFIARTHKPEAGPRWRVLARAISIGSGLALLIMLGFALLPMLVALSWRIQSPQWALPLLTRAAAIAQALDRQGQEEWSQQIEYLKQYQLKAMMLHGLQTGDLDAAMKAADLVRADKDTGIVASSVYRHAASHLLHWGLHAQAVQAARNAFALAPGEASRADLRTALAAQTWFSMHDPDQAFRIVATIPEFWKLRDYANLVDKLQQVIASKVAEAPTREGVEQAISRSQQLLDLRNRGPAGNGVAIPCNLATMLEMQAAGLLKEGKAGQAIASLQRAAQLVDASPVGAEMLPLAYTLAGHQSLEASDPHTALAQFSEALKLDPGEEKSCLVGEAMQGIALVEIESQRFSEARRRLQQAEGYCPTKAETRELLALADLHEGLQQMAFGNWYAALELFGKSRQAPGLEAASAFYVADVDAAIRRQFLLDEARSLGPLEAVSGNHCVDIDAGTCKAVSYFQGSRKVGHSVANDKGEFRALVFGGNRYRLLLDAAGRGHFDSYRAGMGNRELENVDVDGDFWADWQRSYVNDIEISARPLSGRAEISFNAVSGASALDLLSAPDLYLAVAKNHQLVGRTETVDNDTKPSYQTRIVVHVTARDFISIRAYEVDPGVDVFIDGLTVRGLPSSGYAVTEQGLIGLQIIVEPTGKLEGAYRSAEASPNVFDDPSFATEQSVLGDLVRRAEQETARAEVAAIIGAIAVPEAAILTAGKRLTTVEQLVGAWVGFEAMYAELSPSE